MPIEYVAQTASARSVTVVGMVCHAAPHVVPLPKHPAADVECGIRVSVKIKMATRTTTTFGMIKSFLFIF